MNDLTITQLFEKLDAPLKNNRWSWGAIRSLDKTIFIRVWQDGIKKIDSRTFIWVSDLTPPDHDLGAQERLTHVELLKNSEYKCFLIMCEATEKYAAPRTIKSFNERELFACDRLVVHEDAYWVELNWNRFTIKELLLASRLG